MSSTPSSMGDEIDWKLLSRMLDDAIDDCSPSVIEPNAESCDGLLTPDAPDRCPPRMEYSMRRDVEFFLVMMATQQLSVVSWLLDEMALTFDGECAGGVIGGSGEGSSGWRW